MVKYLVQVTYSDESLATLVSHPQDRGAVLSELFERLGGKVEVFYHALGDFDLVMIAELPDNESIAALNYGIRATGVTASLKSTMLLSSEEGMNALRRAGSSGYKPPS
jgi:uncharacterized protein with GYD domain